MLRLSRGDRGLDSAAHGVTARWSRSAAGVEVNLIIALSRKYTDKQYSCFMLIAKSHKRIGGLRYVWRRGINDKPERKPGRHSIGALN